MSRDDPSEPRVGQPLPAAAGAYIDPAKLIRYALDPESPDGRHKAVVFRRALGIEHGDWWYLRDAILTALPHHSSSAFRQPRRPGQVTTWELILPVDGLNGRRRLVVTAWKMNAGRPVLVSVMVAHKRQQGSL